MAQKKTAKKKSGSEAAKEAAAKIMAHEAGQSAVQWEGSKMYSNNLGLDVGTSKIVLAQKSGGKAKCVSQLNAFITVAYSKFTEDILNQNEIRHFREGKTLVVYGDGAEVFANMMNREVRRPMQRGLLNPQEASAIEIIQDILNDVIPDAKQDGATLRFSVPGTPRGESESDGIYHAAVLKRALEKKGYKAESINEGLAVIFSELKDEEFTGLGISAGGGMCNVCLSFLSVPVLTFGIKKGGDYIDDAAASVTGEVNTLVRKIKENGLCLTATPKNEIEDALCIYYDDLIRTLVEEMRTQISGMSRVPKFDKAVPIVLSGGTVMPEGFQDRFEEILNQEQFPIEISEVRIAEEPLLATAKGSLLASLNEG